MEVAREMTTPQQLLERQQRYYASGETRDVSFRLAQLKKLKQAVVAREAELMGALRADLNKSEHEAYALEIGIVYGEISFMIKHLKRWAKPRKVKTALTHIGSRGYIVPEPLGTALIIAPWNYPVNLAIAPLAGAIAAGNTVILKPSELSPAVSAVLAGLVKETFDPAYVAVAEGGVEVSRALTELPFDKIFYTGGTEVGKLVMAAAAKHLTPVTLELGGKSPCIVHSDADIALAAKRIVFGKFVNAGQTCLAPDYLLVQGSIKEPLLAAMRAAITASYGEEPLLGADYARIVSPRHFARLDGFLEQGNALIGGSSDAAGQRIEPTVLDGVDWHAPVMQEEIFGPILPLFAYDELEEALARIRSLPKPLALYYFGRDRTLQDRVMNGVPFGGGCVNDTLLHMGTPYLPFGGVGASGMGAYHGEFSFRAFSHMKSILKQTTKFDFPFRYPSSKNGLKMLRKIMKP